MEVGGTQRVAPPELMRRSVVARLAGLVGVGFFGEIGYGLVVTFALPLYLTNTLAWRVSSVGPVLSAFLFAEAVGKFLLAGLSDKLGRKPLIVAGVIISGIAIFLMTRETSHWGFIALSGLNGIGGAAVWPNVFAAVADVTDDHERVGALSLFNMMNMIGLGASPLLGSLVSKYALKHDRPESLIFPVTAALFVICFGFAVFFIPWLKVRETEKEAFKDDPPDAKHHIVMRVLIFFLVLSFLQTLGLQIMSGSLVIYLNKVLHISAANIGKPFIVLVSVVGCMAVPVGAFGGWWGRAKSVKLGLALAAAGMVLLPVDRTVYWFLSIAIPMLLGILMSVPAWLAIITDLAPESWRGRVFGYVSTAQSAGAIVGPSVGTWLFEKVGPAAPFHASGLVLCVALLAALFGLSENMRAVAVRPVKA